MQSQLITIDREGGVTSLRVAKDRGLDLRLLGPVEIKRSSLIVWDEENQGWFIHLIDTKWGKLNVDHALADKCEVSVPPLGVDRDGVLLFAEYEDAVTAEVEIIQKLRRQFGPNCIS